MVKDREGKGEKNLVEQNSVTGDETHALPLYVCVLILSKETWYLDCFNGGEKRSNKKLLQAMLCMVIKNQSVTHWSVELLPFLRSEMWADQ